MCVQLGAELFRAPEALFRPDIAGSEHRGVHDCIVKAAMKSDMDLRRVLFSQIVLSGGSTLFQGEALHQCLFGFQRVYRIWGETTQRSAKASTVS